MFRAKWTLDLDLHECWPNLIELQGRWKHYGHSRSRFQQFINCKLYIIIKTMNNNYLGAWWFTDAIVFLYIHAILIGKYFKTWSKKAWANTRWCSSIKFIIALYYDLCHLSTLLKLAINAISLDYKPFQNELSEWNPLTIDHFRLLGMVSGNGSTMINLLIKLTAILVFKQ